MSESLLGLLLLFQILALAFVKAEEEPGETWQFEPRLWTHEDEETIERGTGWSISELDTLETDIEWPQDELLSEHEDPHQFSHFFTRSAQAKMLANDSTDSSSRAKECNQFRVDIREAVICDKQRCDKLEFDWPKYENQITWIQTTRHGMRFHKVDLAFASQERSGSNDEPKDDKIKFDLLEQIFKPKPKTSTTTTTTTPASTEPTSPGNSEEETSTNKVNEEDVSNIKDDESDSDRQRLMATLRLDTRRKKQKMIGFGGALTDSTCRNIKSLSAGMAKSLMEDYFGSEGLRYNIARLTVGSSDFSTTPYTNNDKVEQLLLKQQQQQSRLTRQQQGESDDLEMKNFRLLEDDLEYKIPIARQAIATSQDRDLKLFASLWSPPIWMKNNSNIVHGYLKGDVYGPYYKALGELMLKWLEAYRRNGIEFWGFTGLNEPVTGVKPFIFHNSLGITKDDYLTFLKLHLGPMMRQRGFGQVKLIFLDDNKGYVPNYVKSAMKDPRLAQMISGVGYHWYMNDEYENLQFIERDFPEKFVLSTEACNGYLPFQIHALPGDWDRGVAYMLDIIKGLQQNSAGWVDWNMALDLSGGPSWAKNNLDAAIIVNSNRDEYYKSPMFYALGHFSRFVEPDSVRLEHRLANARFDYPLECVAFLTPQGYVVVVALNANRTPVPLRLIVNRRPIRLVTLKANSFNTIVFKAPAFSDFG